MLHLELGPRSLVGGSSANLGVEFGNPSQKISENLKTLHPGLGGGNSKIFGIFIPNFGEDEPILTNIF